MGSVKGWMMGSVMDDGFSYSDLYIQFFKWEEEGKLEGVLPTSERNLNYPNDLDRYLFKLFGIITDPHDNVKYNDENIRIFKLICGPNGWTFYKMIVAQRNA